MVRNCAPENPEIPDSVLSDRPGKTVLEGLTAIGRRAIEQWISTEPVISFGKQ